MRSNGLLAIGALALCCSCSALGRESRLSFKHLLFATDAVKVTVDDQVRNGCLPRPDAVRSAALATLRQELAIVALDDSSFLAHFAPYFTINALGFAPKSSSGRQPRCIVQVDATLNAVFHVSVPYSAELPDGPLRPRMRVDIPFSGSLLEGSREGMQARVEAAASQQAEKFLAAIRAAREAMRRDAPEVWALYEQARERQEARP